VMEARRIRSEWAAASLAHDGSVVVCVQHDEAARCLYFESLAQLKEASDNRHLSVKKWAVAVPGSCCILKRLVLPASDSAEAAKMVEFELPSLVPLPLEEIVYGCMPLSSKDNVLNVLVCIVKRNTLNEHLEPYRAAGIEPHRVALEPLAMQNWFGNTGACSDGPAVNAVADIHRAVVLTSVDNCLQRVNEIDLSDTDCSAPGRELLQEVLNQREELAHSTTEQVRTLMVGSEPSVSEIGNAARTGSGGLTDNVVIIAGPKLNCYGREQELNGGIFCCQAVAASGLFDLAKNAKLPFSNLLPKKSLKKLEQKTLLLNYLYTGGAFAVVVVLLWLCLFVMNGRIERRSRNIERQIASIEHVAGGVDKKRQRVRAIESQLSNRGLITRVFQEIYRFTPKNISISHIKFLPTAGGAFVEIKGQANSLPDAYEYTETMLREAVLLNKIEIVNNQLIPRPGGSIAEFKARCVIYSD